MKKYTKFLNLLGSVLLIISFVLLLTTSGIIIESQLLSLSIAGTKVLFGGEITMAPKVNYNLNLTPLALIAFILIIIGLLIILIATLYKLFVKDTKNLNMIILCGALISLIGGIFVFTTKSNFLSANDIISDSKLTNYTKLSGGYITSGVLAILGGIISSVDPIVSLINKSK